MEIRKIYGALQSAEGIISLLLEVASTGHRFTQAGTGGLRRIRSGQSLQICGTACQA
jgi:hypothetical protein